MVVNLIKSSQMFSLTLPEKIKGRYWLTDLDDSRRARALVGIEAVEGRWIVRSTPTMSIIDAAGGRAAAAALEPMSFFNVRIDGSEERVILFTEDEDMGRRSFRKYVVRAGTELTIGRTNDNAICYANSYVSSHHAKLSYDGQAWRLTDTGSTNGTYVNDLRVQSQRLDVGDMVFIMGLRIVLGRGFFAVNDPGGRLVVSPTLGGYRPQRIEETAQSPKAPEEKCFYRSARFRREVEEAVITIDPPPQLQKMETVPMALMLGPSLTMGLASLSTGILTVSNVVSTGGDIVQALPTMVMSVSMLLGTVLWPILTKKHEKKVLRKSEERRQERYLAYLDSVRDEIRRRCKEQTDILRENAASPDDCASRIAEEKPTLWDRTITQRDFLQLRLGIGDLPLSAEIKCAEKKFSMEDDALQDAMLSLYAEPKQLTGVPVSVSLPEVMTLGACGAEADIESFAKTMILQMIALHSYDELKLILLVDREDEDKWEFVRCIPHFWSDDRQTRFLATSAEDLKDLSAYMEKNILSRGDVENREFNTLAPYYVVISVSEQLTKRCAALQRLLSFKNNCGASALLLAHRQSDLPKETRVVVELESDFAIMTSRDDTTGSRRTFVPDRVNEAILTSLAQDIANIHLDMGSGQYQLPQMLSFLEMFHVGKIEHLNALTRWKENNPAVTLQTPVGLDSHGDTFELDLHEKFHGPHGLVAGMTGSGKSEFIITYILSLAVNYHPDEVSFILIDYKGGGLAGAFEDELRGIRLPHLAGTITNLDGAAVKRSLISIQSELRRRQAVFNEARKQANEGTMDIYKYQQLYRDRVVSQPMPHLFIISDEFAELKAQQPEFMEQLISAARIGRSLGVHLILATQKPSGVVDDQIWSNSKFRVCLKVQEKADSQEMIKCPDAAELTQTGRFYLQVGFNELFALGQSAWCGAEYVPTEVLEKSVDKSIQIVDNLGRVKMNAKPMRQRTTESKTKQIVAVIKYLSDLAAEENVSARPLWLPAIPAEIYIDALEQKYGVVSKGTMLEPIIGEYDDPFNQRQGVLTMPLSEEGNCLVYGSVGNGKAELLTALVYSLLRNHSAEEVNIYIMDFGAETLRVFEDAPQVGSVMSGTDEECVCNLMKLLRRELEQRKALLAEYGGDLRSYCASGNSMPGIVVLLNNYAVFSELFEEELEAFSQLTRDGVRYGIYFVVTASSVSDVRYRTQQNFKQMLTLQLNDASDYSTVVGKTDGLIPTHVKGRGLVARERVYEFQTASCVKGQDTAEYLRSFCKKLRSQATKFAPPVPVLPAVVKVRNVRSEAGTLMSLPLGIARKSLRTATVDMERRVVFPVAVEDVREVSDFVAELSAVASQATEVVIVDGAQIMQSCTVDASVVSGGFEAWVGELFSEMVLRHNTFKDAQMDLTALEGFTRRLYIIPGLSRIMAALSDDGKDKLTVLLEKAESSFKLHFVVIDDASQYASFSYQPWYKRHCTGSDGLWIGDGVADQYVIKVGRLTAELYQPLEADYGYLITKGRPELVKLLSARSEEETDG